MNEAIICFAWMWIIVGLTTGAIIGLQFYKSDWLGGYNSWERRMIRLGHIAFLGTGLLNIALVVSSESLGFESVPRVAGIAMVIGALSMPTVCYLSAYRQSFRHLFGIPVVGLFVGASNFAWTVVARMWAQ